jgi:hypothetical protein
MLPGVGRKTANLVLIVAHQSPDNICVDTHVHRISNRLGWVETRTPEKTEQALYRVVPRRWWPDVNLYLVIWGQRVCRPIRPRLPSTLIHSCSFEYLRSAGYMCTPPVSACALVKRRLNDPRGNRLLADQNVDLFRMRLVVRQGSFYRFAGEVVFFRQLVY